MLLALWLLAAPPHADLTYYLADDGSRRAVQTADDWAIRRRQIVAGMEAVMGPLPRPERPVPLAVRVVEETTLDNGLVRRKLAYRTDSPEREVRAWLLLPPGAKRLPAVLCLHQTTPGGKDEPAGLGGNPNLFYALELAREGFVTLSPDYPSFGEHAYDFPPEAGYASGSMKAIYDNVRAVDLLQSLPEVDPERIGAIGHSLGGHNALFTAVFEPRLRAVVTCCGYTRFHKYYEGRLAGWTSPRYMPRIAAEYGADPDRVPFDFPEILGALAPRPVLTIAPERDDNFDVSGVRESLAAAARVYELLGAPENLRARHPDAGHDFPAADRVAAYAFLAEALGGRR